MNCAAIDIGSNTIRLCAYHVKNGQLSMFLNQRVMAKLGSKTQNGALTEEGIEVACKALEELKQYIKQYQIETVFAFATAALRNITNSKEAVSFIEQKTGFCIDVLSGEEEACFTFSGAAKAHNITDGLIADIGGGSTELVLIQKSQVKKAVSLPIGSLTSFVRFVGKRPARPEQIMAIRACVRQMIETQFSDEKATVLYGIGGAPRAAMELEKLLYPDSGGVIKTLEQLLYQLLEDEVLAEKSILQASPERLDTALPGMAILCEVASFFNCKQLDICRAGVREGYLYKQLESLQKEE